MTSPAILLALAPAATALAGRTVAAAQRASQSFASVLGDVFAPATANEPAADRKTVSETLESLASQLRGWLKEQGIEDNYSVNYHLSADGKSQLDTSGESAFSVKQLLASHEGWVDQLRQLASSIQAETSQRFRDIVPPPVTLEIDSADAKAF